MKLTVLAVVILALGIAFGLALHGQLDGSAVAARTCRPKCPTPTATPKPTPPPQQREDQVVIFTTWTSRVCPNGGYQTVGGGCSPSSDKGQIASIELAASDYPTGTTFRWEVSMSSSTTCFRLYDNTADQPVSGSELCESNLGDRLRVRSGPVTLSADSHEYVVQMKNLDWAPDFVCPFPTDPDLYCGWSGGVEAARIIAEWTE